MDLTGCCWSKRNLFVKRLGVEVDYLNNAMAGIWRVLKPKGFFINTLYSVETLSRFSHTKFGYRRFALQELNSAGLDNGFNVKVAPILNGAAHCVLYLKTG